MYKYLPHTGDIKIQVKAKDEFEFFSNIVNSVNDSIFLPTKEKFAKKKELIVDANSIELLIHNFVDELVYISNYDHLRTKLITLDFDKKEGKYVLSASFNVCQAEPEEYKIEVKGVAFGVKYKEDAKTKEKSAEFILDI